MISDDRSVVRTHISSWGNTRFRAGKSSRETKIPSNRESCALLSLALVETEHHSLPYFPFLYHSLFWVCRAILIISTLNCNSCSAKKKKKHIQCDLWSVSKRMGYSGNTYQATHIICATSCLNARHPNVEGVEWKDRTHIHFTQRLDPYIPQ